MGFRVSGRCFPKKTRGARGLREMFEPKRLGGGVLRWLGHWSRRCRLQWHDFAMQMSWGKQTWGFYEVNGGVEQTETMALTKRNPDLQYQVEDLIRFREVPVGLLCNNCWICGADWSRRTNDSGAPLLKEHVGLIQKESGFAPSRYGIHLQKWVEPSQAGDLIIWGKARMYLLPCLELHRYSSHIIL